MLCVRKGRVSLKRFYYALIVEMAGHLFCNVVHIIQLMLSTDRYMYMYRSYKWFISIVWFTKSGSLLPLAKKSLLFKTGAEK